MQRSNVVGFKTKATSRHLGASTLSKIITQLRDNTKQRVAHLLRQLFNSADDALFAMADKAGSNGDQTHYFDAMRELRLQKKHIATDVVKALIASFDEVSAVKAPQQTDPLDSLDDLDLVEKEDMELKVAIEGMVGRVRSTAGTSLEELRCRYEALIKSSGNGHELLAEDIPSSPEVLCEAFVNGMESLDVTIRARLVVLKLFEQHVLAKMADVYTETNELLVKQGVLPDLKAHQRAHKPGNAAPPKQTSQSDGHSNSDAKSGYLQNSESVAGSEEAEDLIPTLSVSFDSERSSGHPSGGGTVHDLSDLLHTARNATHASEPPMLSVSRYSQADIFNTLASFQNEQMLSVANGGACEVIDFRSVLNARLAAQSETTATFSEIDEDVINLVSMLFEFILDDSQLQPVMKALIARMQIPMLKVALMDRSFFSKGGHPARQLLNLIASSAIGWTEAPEGRPDHLREEIENVVETTLNEFDDNIELFSELFAKFEKFVDKEERRRMLVERRISDSEQGKAANEIAQAKVRSTIKQIVQGRDIPETVTNIIEDGLSRAMLLSFLKEGENSAEWKKHLRVVEDLAWSVAPLNVDENTRSTLLSKIPKVVSSVRQTLQEISFDEFKLNDMLTELETEHIRALGRIQWQSQETTDESTVAAPESAESQPEIAIEDSVEGSDDSQDQEEELISRQDDNAPFLLQVDKFTVGCWFEFIEEERAERCKLAAIIKVTGKYIFVNRSGVKVAERTREELAEDLSQSRVQILNDGLLFDRALESVITNLRDKS